MKKTLYIVLAVFALGMVSCSKEDIKPNVTSNSNSDVPVWKSAGVDGTEPTGEGPGHGSIVDPNIDPELESEGS